MTTAATALPLLGLRITAGPVELRGVTDDLLGPLADLAIKGIHDPDFMPFSVPWSIAPADEMPRNFAQFHWGQRAGFSPEKWGMDLAVFFDGELVGVPGVQHHGTSSSPVSARPAPGSAANSMAAASAPRCGR